MSGRLQGKVAIVTGGLRGIGAGIVERFLEEGCLVAVCDLDETSSVGDTSSLRYFRCDVTVADDWSAMFRSVERSFGHVGILVNNAGGNRPGSIADMSEDDWNFVIQTNLTSVFLGCRQAIASMRGHGGSIINIASAVAKRPNGGQCAYTASKAGVIALTQSASLHLAGQTPTIRCNAICPGLIDTPLLARQLAMADKARVDRIMSMQLVGRLGSPRDIGDAAVFLASSEADFITGTALDVDAGYAIAS